jgi:plasmid maintenance system antidote protein VapI
MKPKEEESEDLIRILRRMKLLDIKHKKVAKEIGITDVYLSYILHEKRPMSVEIKYRLKKYLGLL